MHLLLPVLKIQILFIYVFLIRFCSDMEFSNDLTLMEIMNN